MLKAYSSLTLQSRRVVTFQKGRREWEYWKGSWQHRVEHTRIPWFYEAMKLRDSAGYQALYKRGYWCCTYRNTVVAVWAVGRGRGLLPHVGQVVHGFRRSRTDVVSRYCRHWRHWSRLLLFCKRHKKMKESSHWSRTVLKYKTNGVNELPATLFYGRRRDHTKRVTFRTPLSKDKPDILALPNPSTRKLWLEIPFGESTPIRDHREINTVHPRSFHMFSCFDQCYGVREFAVRFSVTQSWTSCTYFSWGTWVW